MPPPKADPPAPADLGGDAFKGLRDVLDSTAFVLFRNVTLFLVAVLWTATTYWVYADARRRIHDPWLRAVATALGVVPFVGPLVYLFFRPAETLVEAHERRLELASLERDLAASRCPSCGGGVEPHYLCCPLCAAKLRTACSSCGEALALGWRVCPFCESPVRPDLERSVLERARQARTAAGLAARTDGHDGAAGATKRRERTPGRTRA